MFRLLEAIFTLNIKQYIQHNAIKWTRSRLYKVLIIIFLIKNSKNNIII
jgi:hypothetical protein